MLTLTEWGLYCAAGDFYVDPRPDSQNPAPRSIITHGHADHARANSLEYLCTGGTAMMLRHRLEGSVNVRELEYGETLTLGSAKVSLHPAGHILGSAQVRVEVGDEVWVVSGDYKRDSDPSCEPFELVPCDVFITEATFALPAYRWTEASHVAQQILHWWRNNAAQGVTSILFCYALGKAQRILAELARLTDVPVYVHGALVGPTEIYRQAGVNMLPTHKVTSDIEAARLTSALVLAPPSAQGSPWMKRFKRRSTGFASGWMRVRGNRRRRGYDRGFVISDHADWPSLLQTISETGARRVLVTHGESYALCRYLKESGVDAMALDTRLGDGAHDGEGAESDSTDTPPGSLPPVNADQSARS